jgi:hypothetical protein
MLLWLLKRSSLTSSGDATGSLLFMMATSELLF